MVGPKYKTPTAAVPVAYTVGAGCQASPRSSPQSTKSGYVYDSTRQYPPNPSWGLLPAPGKAEVYTYPDCRIAEASQGNRFDRAASAVRCIAQAPSTLLTKCLCGRDKRRAGAARLHVFAPKATARPPLLGSRHAQKARILAISRSFEGAC
jgi:hypothetical protein